MTSQPFDAGRVPEWTRGDYLRKARVAADMTVKQLSIATGISEKTINNYEADRHEPRRPNMLAWAMATGVPLSWLESGTLPSPPNGDGPDPSGLTPNDALTRLTASKSGRSHGTAHNRQYESAA